MLSVKQANFVPVLLVVAAFTGCRASQKSAATSPSSAVSSSPAPAQGYALGYPVSSAGGSPSDQGNLAQTSAAQPTAPTGPAAPFPSQQFSSTASMNSIGSTDWNERNSRVFPSAKSASSSSRCTNGCCN